jgi:hypothetical protein
MKDKRNGAGILTKADGTKQEGEWKEDQLVTPEDPTV